MSEWKTIDSAPKDGRSILIFDPLHDAILIAFYRPDGRPPGKFGHFVWQLQEDGGAIAEQVVTHWQHLPDPPVTA